MSSPHPVAASVAALPTAEQLREQLEHFDCKAAFEVITPEKAEQWLAVNAQNRQLEVPYVKRISRLIQRNEWMPDSTDAIGIDHEGRVTNGQHRLSAVVLSGVPIIALVVRGVRPEVIRVIDQVKPRNLTQVFLIQSVANAALLAQGLQWLYKIRYNLEHRVTEPDRATNPQFLVLLEEHPDIQNSLLLGNELSKRLASRTAGMFAAYHYVCSTVDPDGAKMFFDQLLKGENLAQGDPILSLREMYTDNKARVDKGLKKATRGPGLAAWLVNAWEMSRDDKAVASSKKLAWNPKSKFPRVSGLSWPTLVEESDDEAA
jgi:hypothetical protein